MKAVGEVAAMGRSFEEALLKAIRSLETTATPSKRLGEVAAADDVELADPRSSLGSSLKLRRG